MCPAAWALGGCWQSEDGQDQGSRRLGPSRTITPWRLPSQRCGSWNPSLFSCFNSSALSVPSLFSIPLSALCLSVWAWSLASANHCFSFVFSWVSCPLFLRRSSFASVRPSLPLPLLWVSSSKCLAFLSGCSLFYHFILCISSLYIFPFFSFLFCSQKTRSHLGCGVGESW